jgi:carbon storage regulator
LLVLSRTPGQEIIIDERITLTVLSVRGGKISLGITAPRDVQIDRLEVRERTDYTPRVENSDTASR